MRYLFTYTVLMLAFSCQTQAPKSYHQLDGETMGTYYRVTWEEGHQPVTKGEIDSILVHLNRGLSTYDPTSLISKINGDTGSIYIWKSGDGELTSHMLKNLNISREIHTLSDGYYDPTVMPLVNYWGFGYVERIQRANYDSLVIDSLAGLVDFDGISWNDSLVQKSDARMQLDFSAVAKGYALDVLASFLEKERGVANYYIDIGGEASVKGNNPTGSSWRIGISSPSEGALPLTYDCIISLSDNAIATSGNYRNFYEIDGKYISHTINPKTGFFERNNLLSASVITPSCARADALATACMAMGFERARKLVESLPDVEAVFIYQDEQNKVDYFITNGIREAVQIL